MCKSLCDKNIYDYDFQKYTKGILLLWPLFWTDRLTLQYFPLLTWQAKILLQWLTKEHFRIAKKEIPTWKHTQHHVDSLQSLPDGDHVQQVALPHV